MTTTQITAAARSIAGTAIFAAKIYFLAYVVFGAVEYAVFGEITVMTANAASLLTVIVITIMD